MHKTKRKKSYYLFLVGPQHPQIFDVDQRSIPLVVSWRRMDPLVFHQLKTPPTEVVSNIWLDIFYTLKGQCDNIVGDSDAKIAQQHEFLIIWTATPFMTSNYGTPC